MSKHFFFFFFLRWERESGWVFSCSVATLGSWRTTAGGGRALQSAAKSEATWAAGR